MPDNLEQLREAATWARALTWPVEVADARLGKTATQFMELATPDVMLGLLKQIEGLHAAVNSECQDWAREHERSRRFSAELKAIKAENEVLRKAAGQVLEWTEASHRPPVADEIEHGRMVPVRLHALAGLHDSMRLVGTFVLTGRALEWAVLQPLTDQPKTFGCHHNMPTCSMCEDMVRRWLVKELGETVNVPAEFLEVSA